MNIDTENWETKIIVFDFYVVIVYVYIWLNGNGFSETGMYVWSAPLKMPCIKKIMKNNRLRYVGLLIRTRKSWESFDILQKEEEDPDFRIRKRKFTTG